MTATEKKNARGAGASKKKTAKKATKKKTATKKTAKKKATKKSEATALEPRPTISAQERDRMIAERAYHFAQGRRPGVGDPATDWFAAAAEIDARYDTVG